MTRRNQDAGAFGVAYQLPSGRWQARYFGPEGSKGRRYKAPTTFRTKGEARKFLASVQTDIIRGKWVPPADDQMPATKPLTLAEYAKAWLEHRPLKDRTKEHYGKLLDHHFYGKPLANLALKDITADDVRAWYAKLDKKTPTQRSHCYGLLRTIMGTALTDGRIAVNPVHIRGAGSVKRAVLIKPLTLDEAAKLIDAMPKQYQALTALAIWCALRFGELAELRRKDVDLDDEVIHVRRAVVRVEGEHRVGTPKSEAGQRDVHMPSHIVPMVKAHMIDRVATGKEALLFPAATGENRHLATATLHRHFKKAAAAAGQPDLRFHDTRHAGATLAAQSGATLAELMGRLGHSTPAAAMRYQHAAEDRDRALAAALSKLATGGKE